jgi:hypothetical protein
MSLQSLSGWHEGALEPLEYSELPAASIVVADSWRVIDGTARAIALHRDRFLATAGSGATAFWDAAIAAIPRTGDWFPRVELHSTGCLVLRLRPTPPTHRSAILATWGEADPRTVPAIKGPDIDSLLRIRAAVQSEGATEAVILGPDGYIVDGAYSALLWWRGDILCGPPRTSPRVDSVTSRTVLALATALGLDTYEEAVTPAEIEGTELWVLSALHGARIATAWSHGPQLAEKPGRLGAWQSRLDALRRDL